MQGIDYAVADLNGKPFLDLEAAGIGFDNPGNLAQTGYLSVWNIRNMAFADEGEHVMLAHRIEFNVLDKDHLLVLLVKYGGLDYLLSILPIALGEELEGFCHPLRGLQQAFTVGIFTQEGEYLPDPG